MSINIDKKEIAKALNLKGDYKIYQVGVNQVIVRWLNGLVQGFKLTRGKK